MPMWAIAPTTRLRINGAELRCKVVGEGGNLGFTQKGRIEAAQHGVLLNTDFIDNSAGVDTSDHEVNIKILLDDAVQRSEITVDGRNTAARSDDRRSRPAGAVGQLSPEPGDHPDGAPVGAPHRLDGALHPHAGRRKACSIARWKTCRAKPNLTERKTRGLGMTRPELSVLLSYDKIRLYQQLLDSDVPEDPYLSKELVRYFPAPLHDKYAEHMQRHRLKREIIATAVTNSTVNRMGATFMMRMQEDTGQGPAAIAKAYTAAREILGARELWAQIEALDSKVAENTQVDAILQIWSLLRHITRWLLNRPGGTLEIAANVERYQIRRRRAAARPCRKRSLRQARPTSAPARRSGKVLGCPPISPCRLAKLPELRAMLDMVEVAQQTRPAYRQSGQRVLRAGSGAGPGVAAWADRGIAGGWSLACAGTRFAAG